MLLTNVLSSQNLGTGATALLVMLMVILYLALTRIATWRRLSSFPGPFLASISYLPMLQNRRSRRPHLRYASLSERYGTLTRIGPNDLLASDPDLLHRMSAVRSTYQRSDWYKATRLDPYHDMMGSVLDKRVHASMRTKMGPGYSGRDNPGLDTGLDTQIQALVALIKREYVTFPSATVIPVDFGRLADFYAHDARAALSFGSSLGMLERNRDVYGIIAIVKLALEWIQVFTDIPPLQRIFLSKTALKLLGPKPTDDFGVGKLMGMARELVASRFAPGAKAEQDLLGSFLRHGVDRRSAESEVMFPIIAGSDTTATALKMTVAYLAYDARVSAILKAEVRNAILSGNISSPVTNEEALQLPYLQAVIWESLRIHPPFGGLIMKQVGPDGDIFNGTPIPSGTRVAHSTWAVTHDTRVFGDDVDVFRPERWSDAGEKTRNAMRKQTELVFGSGRFGCPGRAIALKELNKILVELFRLFDIQPVENETRYARKTQELFSNGSVPLVIKESPIESD